MRIVQLIDSLEIGGAEKMAVNYANSLSKKIDFSGLVVTRAEGNLKHQLYNEVSYHFLNRKKIIDFRAVFKFRNYCKDNNIDFIHAHGTSYFFSVLLKIIYPKVKIIWHEHFGARSSENIKKNSTLLFCSFLFKGIVVVNKSLEEWCKKNLKCKNIILLNNFTIQDEENPSTILKGLEGKRIVCMANLKNPKNHSFLVEIANQINITYPEWSFHFIGKDFRDDYSNQIKEKIKKYNLNETVFIYGVKNDTFNILQQSDIAVLTSISEGMPVSLIEYGMMKMPVVLTKVGEIPFIIEDQKNGFLVDLNDINSFCNCLAKLINDKSLRNSIGNALFETIDMKFSSNKVISKYLNWIES